MRMLKLWGKGNISSIVIGLVSAVVVDVIFNERVMTHIKKGATHSRQFLKELTRAGADAYQRSRNKFSK